MLETNKQIHHPKISLGLNKMVQKQKILNLLHSSGYISAPELSQSLRISLPTGIGLLNDMISAGYVEKVGIGESSGGRKPSLYGIPKNAFFVISCDIARYSSSVVICDSSNRFATPVENIDTHIDDPDLIEKLYKTSTFLLNSYQIPNEKVLGIGVSMPGLIDSKKGINHTIKNESYRNVGRNLKSKFDKIVYIDNDARMHAHGEFHYGAAKDYKNAVIIHWSWGIGLGIFVNGHLYSGNNGFAGEFSHIAINENGDLCSICGKKGCLETLASSSSIMKKVHQGFSTNEISLLINEFRDFPQAVTPEDVIHAARLGDEFCISILNEIGKEMGKGLSYLIQLLNPGIIVVSGPLSKANQYVLYPIKQALNRFCLEKILENTKIIISDMGDQSALLGTAEMVFQKVFNIIHIE